MAEAAAAIQTDASACSVTLSVGENDWGTSIVGVSEQYGRSDGNSVEGKSEEAARIQVTRR